MADFIIKPAAGDNLKIQDEAGGNAIQVLASADTMIGSPSGQNLVLQPTSGKIVFKDDQGTERLSIAATTGLTHFSNMSGLFNYGVTEKIGTSTAATTTCTVDLATGNFFEWDLTGTITTFTINNTSQTANQVSNFVLKVKQHASSLYDFTWATIVSNGTNIDWPGGIGDAPPISQVANAVDIMTFTTFDNGTTWYGATLGSEFG